MKMVCTNDRGRKGGAQRCRRSIAVVCGVPGPEFLQFPSSDDSSPSQLQGRHSQCCPMKHQGGASNGVLTPVAPARSGSGRTPARNATWSGEGRDMALCWRGGGTFRPPAHTHKRSPARPANATVSVSCCAL